MKNDGKTLLFPLLLAAFLLTPGILSAQQRGAGKREDIRVPSGALVPFYTPDYFSGKLKKFKTWLEAVQLPPSGAEFKKRAKEFSVISDGNVRTKLLDMRGLAMEPDLEEVTKLPRSWYAQIYNAARPLQVAAEALNENKIVVEERRYQTAKKVWNETVENVLAVLEKPPKKLSREELEIIAAKNRDRRRKEYIKWYRAKQAEEQKKAREKAAGKKMTDKPKKKSEEMEEK